MTFAFRNVQQMMFTLIFVSLASVASGAEPWMSFGDDFDTSMLKARNFNATIVEENGESYLSIAVDKDKEVSNLFVRRDGELWDLGDAPGLVFEVTNDTDRDMAIHARVDGPGKWGESATSASRVGLMPGQRGQIRVKFDKNYGSAAKRPVDPKQVKHFLIFIDHPQSGDKVQLNSVRLLDPEEASTPPVTVGTTKTQVPGTSTLLDASMTSDLILKPGTDQITVTPTEDGVDVNVEPGPSGYPSLYIRTKDNSPWDLSAHGYLTASVTNTGDQPIHLSMRIDNPGHHSGKPWNVEAKNIKPGKTEIVKVIFGHAHGFKPSYKLDPSKIKQIVIFTGKSATPVSYRIESIAMGGELGEKPPIKPDHVRTVPSGGVILGANTNLAEDIKASASGGKAEIIDGAIQIEFPAGDKKQRAAVRPIIGRWNLRDYLQVEVTITNTGDASITPRVRLDSNKGDTPWAQSDTPVAPGESRTVTASFINPKIWQGPQPPYEKKPFKGTDGNVFASNVVSAVSIAADPVDAARSLRVDAITAGMPPARPLPEWLGQRPPVEGDWSLTFEDNFDGDTIDLDRWNIYTPNYWDKKSHFSKHNVIVGDGVVKLRFEKRHGHHADDPERHTRDYATGYLDTYGRWVQRYGYFEARMKLPEAPGMWPAFWLMPDRGAEAGEQWRRADTGNGGLEFDIMEYLSRWGKNRHTVAYHWDGYGKNHKATGTPIYFAPDEEGFITSGLLWLPGLAVVYANGKEVARWETPRISNVRSHPIFTAVSGGWDNDPVDPKTLPSDFVIDYIRIWQLADLASDADGPIHPPAPAYPLKQ